MNSEAKKVNANLSEVRKALAGIEPDWYNIFVWHATPQGADHWIDIKEGNKVMSERDYKYLKSLLKEEEPMCTFVETKTVKSIKKGWHIEEKVWVNTSCSPKEFCLYVGDSFYYRDYVILDKEELRELIAGLTEVLEVLENSND